MKPRSSWLVLLGLAGMLVALGVPAPARAHCPELVNFYRMITQGNFDVWELYEEGQIEETATFLKGTSPTFFAIEDDDFYFFRTTSPSPFSQRWQLYQNDTLVGDFTVLNKQLTLARVECGNFYFTRTFTQGLFTFWELYRSPGTGAFMPPQLLRSFRFLTSQAPTFFNVDDENIWFFRNSALGPFQVWQLYENDVLVRSFQFFNKIFTLATIDDGSLMLYQHTTQGPFDLWTLYENDLAVQSFSFYNKTPTLIGVDNDNMYFFTKTVQGPFTTWNIFQNNTFACFFTVNNINLTLSFEDECDFTPSLRATTGTAQ